MKRKGLFKFCSILYCISILLNSLMPITVLATDNEYLNTTEEVESSETVASNEETSTTTSEEVNFEVQKNTTEENLGVYEFDSNVLKTRMFSNEFVPINTLSQSKGNTRETQKAVYVGENNTGTTDGSQEHPYTTLEDARRSLPNQSGIIYLLKDITLTTNFYIGGTGSLTIASADSKNVHTISRDSSYKGVILQISGDSTASKEVNLQNIIIDGRGDNVSSPLINVKPKLNLNILSGAVLRNNKTTANGGAVYSNDANIVLNGGEISSNISNRGSAIMADSGSVTLTSGTIHSNTASENGGAILMNNGTVSIDGGEIYSNTAKEGGALVLNSGSLTMNAGDSTGQIYLNNASERGGAIFLNNSKFTMEGGNVYSNNAMFTNKNLNTGKGGAVFASNDSTVTMNAGSFYSNDAGTCGGAMNFIDSTFTMNGGVIRDNVAHQQAGAVSLYGKSSATISAGTIKNNELAITKEINELTQSDKAIGMAYGAGGVYVDKQSKLHLTNVIIHENIANEAIQSSTFVSGPFAGGISLCPTSQAYFYLTNGGAIYDNGQIDVTATPQSEFWNTGTPRLFVSDYALGGAEYNWTDENGNPVNARDIIVNENVTKKVYLTSGIDPSYNPSHSVEFVGNETNSVYGGGAIACNGTLVIGTPGDLSVTKIVDGQATEKDFNTEFNFKVTLDAKSINGEYGDMTFTDGVAEFTLKHNETKTATDLPSGITYTVSEEFAHGYTTDYDSNEGMIEGNKLSTSVFTNHKMAPGGLLVSKTVEGKYGDKNKEFNFTVMLDDKTINGQYGDMIFTDGIAHFKLKHGETKVANGLLFGVNYTVIEEEANKDGYNTTATGDKGIIKSNEISKVEFVNTKNSINIIDNISKIIPPNTVDDIISYFILFIISGIGLLVSAIYCKKKGKNILF